MYASRAAKPKLSLNIGAAVAAAAAPPPVWFGNGPFSAVARTPMSGAASPMSPTLFNTRLNQHGMSAAQMQFHRPSPSFVHENPSAKSCKSILKRAGSSSPPLSFLSSTSSSSSSGEKRISFLPEPVVHLITPVELGDDCHDTTPLSRDERRWQFHP